MHHETNMMMVAEAHKKRWEKEREIERVDLKNLLYNASGKAARIRLLALEIDELNDQQADRNRKLVGAERNKKDAHINMKRDRKNEKKRKKNERLTTGKSEEGRVRQTYYGACKKVNKLKREKIWCATIITALWHVRSLLKESTAQYPCKKGQEALFQQEINSTKEACRIR